MRFAVSLFLCLTFILINGNIFSYKLPANTATELSTRPVPRLIIGSPGRRPNLPVILY